MEIKFLTLTAHTWTVSGEKYSSTPRELGQRKWDQQGLNQLAAQQPVAESPELDEWFS
jgi:hypothetical protein